MEKDFTVVDIKEGYLLLQTKEARDFVNQLVENGTLWESLSNILNNYVQNELGRSTAEEVQDLKLILKSLATKVDMIDGKITALPPSSDGVKLEYDKSKVVEPDIEIRVEPKAAVHRGGLSSVLGNFAKMKKGD